jgi:hypothetical protein
MTTATTATDVSQIEALCLSYDRTCAELEFQIANLQEDLDRARTKHLRGLKRTAALVAEQEANLTAAIEAAPELFKKPRTHVFHGVKVGLTGSPGRVEFDDADSVIAQIRKLREEDADVLIRTKEEPNKDALRQLEVPDLRKLGCRIVGEGDQVVVKRTAGDVEKLIAKLIDRMVDAMVSVE